MAVERSIDTLIVEGLTFDNLRAALAMLYFGKEGMTDDEWRRALIHVVPMQHSMENPIKLSKEAGVAPRDTFIEYWIDEDDRVTQDFTGQRMAADDEYDGEKLTPFQTSESVKTARCTIRFMGAQAEAWAKLFHHLSTRRSAGNILYEYCNGTAFPYIGPVRPINIDYFGVQNSTVAYDITFMLQYREVLRIPAERLGLVGVAGGDIELEGGAE